MNRVTTATGLAVLFIAGHRSSQMVRQGDDLYVRSVNGPAASWFRGTRAHHEGLVRRPDGGPTKWAYFLLALKAQGHAPSRRASVS